MIEIFWNIVTGECEIEYENEKFECSTLSSQYIYRINKEGKSIGFICKDNEEDKYLNKMKKTEIKERKEKIKKLQKEIEIINKMELPISKEE